MPDKLFSLANSKGILVDFFPLPADLLGAYYQAEDKPPVILLHSKIRSERRLLRCILAEELGHHFTTGFNLMAFARRNKKYIVTKYEKLATFWAVEYLMPMDKLIKIINSGFFSTHNVAEFFDVTERFAGRGIQLYFEKKYNIMMRSLKILPDEINYIRLIS